MATQTALAGYGGELDNHAPQNNLITFLQETSFVFPEVTRSQPIAKALILQTDLQMVKLVSEVQILLKLYKPLTLLLKKQNQWLVQQVLKIVLCPCNIVSDSQNVVQLVQKHGKN